jgi:hypothetical protein
MPGFFEALSKRKTQNKKHFVCIDGKEYEVSLQKKLEITRHGEEKYYVKDSKIELKQMNTGQYTTLENSDKGYSFIDGDPYWVKSFGEKGYKWTKQG